ncbi:TlpA family protein disulfide reductase [Pedobacter sp. SD-b]|uniref:TlpA family protein disulfide reductase n=2 Tax=Pedobacter segetis TaxID=2793069 RepID=A0ABS1BG55_9SPHI|nr:TlpA family protein disulfide reductase [Pedobacter segetis]
MEVGLFQPSVSEGAKTYPVINNNSVAFKSEDGETISLEDLKGKVIFINFWATWCMPCIAEMAAINKMNQHFKNDVNFVVLMVDADSDFKKSIKFMSRKKYDLKVFIPATEIPGVMFQHSLPTTLLINKKGQIVFKHEGAAAFNNRKFLEFVEKQLKE